MTACITIHFRNPDLTAGCIGSLLADDWAPILVWDNSDDGGASLEVLQAKYAAESRVLLVRNAVNLGFGKGINAALAELGRRGYAGPVLLINNDAQVKLGLQAALIGEIAHGGAPVLVAPRIMQEGREQGWLFYQPWLALVTRRSVPGSFAYLSGCCLLVMRNDNSLPLFDEDFFMYGEDVELSWRIRRDGGRLVLLDDCFVSHAGSASSGRASAAYERFLLHSHRILPEKLASGALSKFMMHALQIPAMLARTILRCLRFRSFAPLRALAAQFGWRRMQ